MFIEDMSNLDQVFYFNVLFKFINIFDELFDNFFFIVFF